MPQVLPPVWLLSMKAGKKLLSQAWSSALLAMSSNGTIASSSISVNMSVESRTDDLRRLAALERGERLDDRLLVGAGVDRLHLDAGVLLLEVRGAAVDDLGDRAAHRDRVVEGELHRGLGGRGRRAAREAASRPRRCAIRAWSRHHAVSSSSRDGSRRVGGVVAAAPGLRVEHVARPRGATRVGRARPGPARRGRARAPRGSGRPPRRSRSSRRRGTRRSPRARRSRPARAQRISSGRTPSSRPAPGPASTGGRRCPR